MKIRKRWACLLLAAMLCFGGLAQAEYLFPDLGYVLETECQPGQKGYKFSKHFTCDVYTWDYPSGWNTEMDWTLALLATMYCGWTAEEGTIDGYAGYVLTTGDGKEQALLVPQFEGGVLLLLPQNCRVAAVEEAAAPQPTARPTARPSVTATPSAGYWEWQYREVDCPYCVRGRCKTCNGSGIYRMYGQTVDCDPNCAACDGVGTYEKHEYVFVPGY